MRDLFGVLLKAFEIVAARSGPPPNPRESRMRALLDGFRTVRERTEASEHLQAAGDQDALRRLLVGYGTAAENHRRQQQEHADDFNLLVVMRWTGKEIRHSMVLAWLLDHDMHKLGTHAQGRLGFRLFLQQFGLPTHYADCKYWVRREVAGDDSIVDIEIACRGQFLIHIENKIWASEDTDQTNREWADLRRRAAGLGLNAEAVGASVHALFLTPHGTKPLNEHFCSISWGRVIRVLEAFAAEAKPVDVKLFAAHYARALRRFIVTQEVREDEHGEGTDE
jgi:hypothetical protein